MNDQQKGKLDADTLSVDFLEDGEVSSPKPRNLYKVVIADDDEEIHKMTKLVLKGFQTEGASLDFIDTYSGRETMELMARESDVAIILLDVVMEEADSGLKVVRHLREELHNNVTRIILRTGQPGMAPEEKVIVEYEIDDYKSKTELTVMKLISTMHVCLRAHRNIKALNRHKEGLHRVIAASQDLFRYHSFTEFLNGMLVQVISLYDADMDSFYVREEHHVPDGMAMIQILDTAKILAGTGKYEAMIGEPFRLDEYPPDVQKLLAVINDSREDELVVREGAYLGIFKQNQDRFIKNYIILETRDSTENLDLIKLFLTNFSLAIDNFMLNMNVSETQNEIIYRIGEIVENRCDSTANHLRRVSKISKLLAESLGLSQEIVDTIELASVMHDVGKVGISDAILLKPGRLDASEFEIMKTHTLIGYNIFKDSKLPLLKTAATIARSHHERFDGQGYPDGKRGGDIPKECEIAAVADVFDALLSKRCYKERWPFEEVVGYMRQQSGSQFAPDVVAHLLQNLDTILEIVEKYPD